MSLSPTYRADWLREDLLRAIGDIQDMRVELAEPNCSQDYVSARLKLIVQEISRVIASPCLPELADAAANAKLAEFGVLAL